MTTLAREPVVRRRLDVEGVVQGVGFRPFAHRLAGELGLSGFARNDPAGARVEVEGPAEAVERFAQRLVAEAPRLARLERVTATAVAVRGDAAFAIAVSDESAHGARTLVPPDTAICDECLAEVLDPADRRHRHPFANCTNCGPRFTVIRDLPYDRPATTMAPFALCPACAREYADPADRRHHAQPICCPACGPRLAFVGGGLIVEGDDAAIAAVQAAWADGLVVALKGLGGYHLTCDAGSDEAVARLRERKGRVDKPFAVMARDVATAAALADLGPAALASLTSPARPIVLARRATGAHAVSALVAPGNPDLGVMLPYTALHHLLLAPVPGEDPAPPAAIVATSGNRSGEPLCTRDEEALERLRDLADAFLVHDREIEIPCDDSVVRVIGEVERPVRRSRGYAPLPLRVPVALPPTLAVGGELKATFCLADGTHAWMSQHIGDLENLETLDALDRSVEAFEAMYRIEPRVIAADLHPAYLSRRWARARRGGAAVVEVQHHHAHAASLMAEHGLDGAEPIVALVFDGTGYGPAVGGGAAAWGGELLVADYDGFERAGRLAELPLPGGDAGVRNPCRTALAYLAACGLPVGDALPPACAADAVERRIVTRQVQTGTGVVPTTSMGRLFDVVASLLDVRQRVSYEGQAAIELEALAATAAAPAGELRLGAGADGVLDPAPLLAGLLAGLDAGAPRAALALGFHAAVSEAAAGLAAAIAAARGLRTAGLTGGVFQNALLARRCRAALEARGLDVLEHRIVPTNDGGLALGQAVIAGRRAARAPIRR